MKPLNSSTLVDAHVHMQRCFTWSHFFHSAYRNFQKSALSLTKDFSAVLLLSEVAGVQYFRDLLALSDKDQAGQTKLLGDWQVFKTEESCSLEVRRAQGESLFMIAGRQIVTQEKLEVLALLSDAQFKDGLALSQVVEEIRAAGAVPVVPWGVGKWLGQRGALLSKFIETGPNNVFLGDNGGRPTFWKHSAHFKLAQDKGLLVLPGSDPLPLSSEVERVGSYGFHLPQKLSSRQPAAELKNHLFAKPKSLTAYGNLQSPLAFFKNQVSIRLR
ncbi:hypothetical protein MNBD_NITROSPIRAE01-1579 [hydrothermal vent metagenome]|uniref:Uncharacterized protein n=1 Tax=hydrothermal vent metagenome TaxID=652676 RepID=A0A3B1D976_9ZZZZ